MLAPEPLRCEAKLSKAWTVAWVRSQMVLLREARSPAKARQTLTHPSLPTAMMRRPKRRSRREPWTRLRQ
jgi:hypothetical protein